jgi:hypothetical protein
MSTQQALALPLPAASNTVVLNARCSLRIETDHRAGSEQAWWKAAGIDPLKVARKFWRETRLDDGENRRSCISESSGPST